jgi:two-component system, LytTR family, response regulator
LLSSESNYSRLSWGKIRPLLGRPLTALDRRLDPNRFFRVNRQQIINLDFIEKVELGVNGRLHAQIREGPEVEISRRQTRLFKTKMSI